MVIARSTEFVAGATPPSEDALPGKKRMHQQLARSLGKAEAFCVAKVLEAGRSFAVVLVNAGLVYAMKQPGFSKRRFGADYMIENNIELRAPARIRLHA